MTVATAAPPTPMCSCVMKNRSSPIFRHDDKTKKTSGMKLLPIARSRPAHKLYANMTSVNRAITEM